MNTFVDEASIFGTYVVEAKDFENESRRSKWARKEKSFSKDFMIVYLADNESKSYEKTISNLDADFWEEEVHSLFFFFQNGYSILKPWGGLRNQTKPNNQWNTIPYEMISLS